LVTEAGIVTAHLLRRSTDRTPEEVADLVLQDPVGRQPDRITYALGFEEFVDLRDGESGVAAEIGFSLPR
jgi:hypothetical protein